MSIDRRKQPRRAFNAPFLIVYSGVKPYRTQALDISIGGVCLILPHNIPTGTLAKLAFDLQLSGKRLPVQAEAAALHSICCTQGFKTGFKFVEVPDTALLLLHRFVQAGVVLEEAS